MSVDLDKTIDVAAVTIKIIGDTAVAAMQVGDVVLPILQDVGLFFPPVAVAANYIAVALPYITKVAQYAPAVAQGISEHKTMIEAAVHVGEAVMSPLTDLLTAIPELAGTHEFFGALAVIIKQSEFTPQDPRFDRAKSDA